MSMVDWVVLVGTLCGIIGYGLWKERAVKTSAAFLQGGRDQRWWSIGLSIMATQASAITFLSMPGQAFEDGLGFVQFYFGQPIAMVLLSAFIVPVFYRLKVFTAYEYLETRFDRRTRQLTALLFLVSRGLAAGVSIYAPAIVLAAVLGWDLTFTCLGIGGVVVLYTVSGGTRIVSRTQTYQMVIMLSGMAVAAWVIWSKLPPITFTQLLDLSGALGKLNAVDTSFRVDTRYNLWSGLTGGLFVGLAYFGTDQSQVQRYLGGESLTQSRLGLMFNGLVKVPMQCLILFVGVLLFAYYQFHPSPLWFASNEWKTLGAQTQALEERWQTSSAAQREAAKAFVRDSTPANRAELKSTHQTAVALRQEAKALMKANGRNDKDADFVFIDFVVHRFPTGLVGLLLAVILCASMSAVAAALSSLGTTAVVDFYKTTIRTQASDAHYLGAAKAFTCAFGVLAVAFAVFASQLDNLIQAVNILGSIFYGPMLGVFLCGFFFKRVNAVGAFYGTLLAQTVVLAVWKFSDVGFLWYNVIGCAAVILSGSAISMRNKNFGTNATH